MVKYCADRVSMRFTITLFLASLFSNQSHSDDRVNLMMRGYVPPSINTIIVQTQLSSSKSLVTFSSQINSKHLQESQKFEVEGLDQAGMDGHVKLVAGNDRTIQYELLINHLKDVMPDQKPIFLKISAN